MPSMKGLGPISYQGNTVPLQRKVTLQSFKNVHLCLLRPLYPYYITASKPCPLKKPCMVIKYVTSELQAAQDEVISLTVKSKNTEADADHGEDTTFTRCVEGGCISHVLVAWKCTCMIDDRGSSCFCYHEHGRDKNMPNAGIALLHPDSCSRWASATPPGLLYMAPARGTDCILTAR